MGSVLSLNEKQFWKMYYTKTGDFSVGPQTIWHNEVHARDTRRVLNQYRIGQSSRFRYV